MSSADSPSHPPRDLEARWQAAWAAAGAFAAPGPEHPGRPCYVLEMFPYPSGDLHMGHVRNYTLGDVHARAARARGDAVLHPMGWDALGLPAENQAIREQVAPQVRTPQNIARMRAQMQRLGLAYDWSRELATSEPAYTRWNQWLFLRLLARGLVYRRQAQVNWCPGCRTVLANEQVLADGVCWRGHPGVTPRQIPEWAFRITAYADELLAGLDTLEGWPERIVTQQRNWLGRSEGARVCFPLRAAAATDADADADADAALEVFTTRVDTLYGCTYLAVAPEHRLLGRLVQPAQAEAVAALRRAAQAMDAATRTAAGAAPQGAFTGSYAQHPLTGADVPVWVATYVIADYGSGAVMAVPAHDVRDAAFARAYGLPVRQAVAAAAAEADAAAAPAAAATLVADGVLVDSGPYTGLASAAARAEIAAALAAAGQGGPTVSWHLRDWGFSRQRYWGTPIPIVHCDACGAVPVPEAELPIVLPDFAEVDLTGEGGAPLAKLPQFWRVPCPRCGEPARRETETMDTFVDSAWYFARFTDPACTDAPFSAAAAARWLPVDVYVGGPEHAVMHLLYFRFFTRAMRDLGLLAIDEPVRRLVTQGMVNAVAYRCPRHGYVSAAAMAALPPAARRCPQCDAPLQAAVEKMSKSKYNGVDPEALIAAHGADTARLYTLFAAPPEKDLEWSAAGVEGVARFVARLWRLLAAQAEAVAARPALPTGMAGLAAGDAEVRRAVHRTLEKVDAELRGRNHFNTAVAALMELVNVLYEHGLHAGAGTAAVVREALLRLAQMLAPFAPHLAEEIWHVAGGDGLVALAPWPTPCPEALARATVTLAVQVGGRRRGEVTLAHDADAAAALAAARAEPGVARHLAGREVLREVVVPGRLVNFVVRGP